MGLTTGFTEWASKAPSRFIGFLGLSLIAALGTLLGVAALLGLASWSFRVVLEVIFYMMVFQLGYPAFIVLHALTVSFVPPRAVARWGEALAAAIAVAWAIVIHFFLHGWSYYPRWNDTQFLVAIASSVAFAYVYRVRRKRRQASYEQDSSLAV